MRSNWKHENGAKRCKVVQQRTKKLYTTIYIYICTTYVHNIYTLIYIYIHTTNPSASQSHSSKQTPNNQTQHIAFTPFARTNTLTFNPFTQQHSTITLPPKFRTQFFTQFWIRGLRRGRGHIHRICKTAVSSKKRERSGRVRKRAKDWTGAVEAHRRVVCYKKYKMSIERAVTIINCSKFA